MGAGEWGIGLGKGDGGVGLGVFVACGDFFNTVVMLKSALP